MKYIKYTEFKANGIKEDEILLLSVDEYNAHKGEFKDMTICVSKDGNQPPKLDENDANL